MKGSGLPSHFRFIIFCVLLTLLTPCNGAEPKVSLGIDILLTGRYDHLLQGKRVGLITNHTAVNSAFAQSVDLIADYSAKRNFILAALFAPEHGIDGSASADEPVKDGKTPSAIPIYSLFGNTYRPTKAMLDTVDVLIYDIQDIGTRSYTYITTLFFAMEEAAKYGKHFIVLDRPNPINGVTIDGPMMEERWRSPIGYVNVAYCHGMTVGELALFFNKEHKVGCQLEVIPMRGWKREMSFRDTGLPWIPTSPHIPEPSTVWYYPTTGMLGELQIVNTGVWHTLPFKLVGAPWIDAEQFAQRLNEQNFPGVKFQPFHYQPFSGSFAKNRCHGVLIVITDEKVYKPVSTLYLLVGVLKNLYPEKFKEAIANAVKRKEMFCRVNGTEEIYRLITQEQYIVWKLKGVHQKERERFLSLREKYLLPNYK